MVYAQRKGGSMAEDLRANKTEKIIFEETYTALSVVDEQYRLDSRLSLAQRDLHKDRIAYSQAELERLEAQAKARDKELTVRRKKIAAEALRMYAAYPEIADDRARVFELAGQLAYGRTMEAQELSGLTKGLIALDTAVSNHAPIIRSINGQFDTFMVPEQRAAGLVPEIRKTYHGEESIELLLPLEKTVSIPGTGRFPTVRDALNHNVLEEFISYDKTERIYRQHQTPAAIATSYDVEYGLERQLDTSGDSHQVMYIIGEELIQEAILHSGKKQGLHGPNKEFSYRAWLAGRLAGYDLTYEPEDIGELIIDGASEIIGDCTRGYRTNTSELINSGTARVLLEAVRQLGAEDQLFDQFASQLTEQYETHTIYGYPEVARTLFDAVIRVSHGPAH